MSKHILIVDDDRQETMFLERFFSKNGYRTTGAYTANALFEAMERESVDLIVLDLILPDEDGLEAVRRVQRESDVPIVILSARNEVFDRIIGLELGADDYVTKPYEPRELLARVRSVLRRYNRPWQEGDGAEKSTLQIGDLILDFTAERAARARDGYDLRLTHTEFELLRAIVSRNGNVISRFELLKQVYGEAPSVTDRAIDAHIARLRRKLSAVENGADLIATVHGAGYRLMRLSNSQV